MIEKWSIAIPRLTGRKKRDVWVYIPDCAEGNPDMRFPVLYMFDGHNVFFDETATYGKSWGMKEYMDMTGTPVIIVGVDCDHRPPHARLNEYSPFSFRDDHFGYVYGKGTLFMDWLCGTLKPLIDERYPTMPDRETTWIAGSSMGGLMTLYAVIAYNHVFGRGAALSPSVWTSVKKLGQMIRECPMGQDTMLYMDYGAGELANHEGMLTKFSRVAAALMEKGINLTTRIIPGGQHCEACWEEQVPFFMNLLTYEGFGWPEQVEQQEEQTDETEGEDEASSHEGDEVAEGFEETYDQTQDDEQPRADIDREA